MGTKKTMETEFRIHGAIMNNALDGAEETSKIIADDSWWKWQCSDSRYIRRA